MRSLAAALLILVIMEGCEADYSPKPRAYPRIDLPDAQYDRTEGDEWNCPYSFEYSQFAFITLEPRYRDSTCWYNLYYPKFRATLHLTYSNVNNNLARHIEESRGLAMKHISMASQIDEVLIERPEERVFGIAYDFKGETATDYQFFLTDSTSHFLRGALYFNVSPNKDSLAPVINYIENDVRHLMETLTWVEE